MTELKFNQGQETDLWLPGICLRASSNYRLYESVKTMLSRQLFSVFSHAVLSWLLSSKYGVPEFQRAGKARIAEITLLK